MGSRELIYAIPRSIRLIVRSDATSVVSPVALHCRMHTCQVAQAQQYTAPLPIK
jgi:hypothetical protein